MTKSVLPARHHQGRRVSWKRNPRSQVLGPHRESFPGLPDFESSQSWCLLPGARSLRTPNMSFQSSGCCWNLQEQGGSAENSGTTGQGGLKLFFHKEVKARENMQNLRVLLLSATLVGEGIGCRWTPRLRAPGIVASTRGSRANVTSLDQNLPGSAISNGKRWMIHQTLVRLQRWPAFKGPWPPPLPLLYRRYCKYRVCRARKWNSISREEPWLEGDHSHNFITCLILYRNTFSNYGLFPEKSQCPQAQWRKSRRRAGRRAGRTASMPLRA